MCVPSPVALCRRPSRRLVVLSRRLVVYRAVAIRAITLISWQWARRDGRRDGRPRRDAMMARRNGRQHGTTWRTTARRDGHLAFLEHHNFVLMACEQTHCSLTLKQLDDLIIHKSWICKWGDRLLTLLRITCPAVGRQGQGHPINFIIILLKSLIQIFHALNK